MSYAAQHQAIREHFAASWPDTPIAWPNAKFVIPDSEAWVRFVISDEGADQISFGSPDNNVFRYGGLVTVMVFSLMGQGDAEQLTLADKAVTTFLGWQDGTSGVLFRQPPFARQVLGRDAKWFHTNVICPFERDSFF